MKDKYDYILLGFNKKIFVLLVLLLSFIVIACNNSNDPVERLKQKIDKAEMVEYIDSVHGVKLLYPNFFSIKKVDNYCAEFNYSDKDVKEICLSYRLIPPRIFDTTDELLLLTDDSVTTCIKKKNHYIILKTEDNEPYPLSLDKYYTSIHGWIRVSIEYDKKYEGAVKRLIKQVEQWKPIPNDDIPKWLNAILDFLDI